MSAIRVLHFADLHLGMENYGRIDPATGLSSRLVDYLNAFDRLVEHALDADVDLVLFAGDAFKNRDPSPTHQREFAKRIRRLAEHAPVFLLVGNHDLPNASGRAHTMEIYQTLEIPNVYVARTIRLHRIPTKRGAVQVLALPWIVRSTFLRREETRGRSLPEVQMLMLERIHTMLAAVLEEADPDLPLILAAHATIQGAVYGSERRVMLGQDLTFPPHMFRHPKVTYGALGHIHKHQQVISDPPVVYSGSLERIDFGEEKEDKGFIQVELRRQKNGTWAASWEFHPLAVRRFVTIRVDAQGERATETVLKAIERHRIEDAVVRLFIHTDAASEPYLDMQRIRSALTSAFYVAALHRDVERPVRLRLGTAEGVETLGPLDLLRQYFNALGTESQRVDVLIRHAQALMAEE